MSHTADSSPRGSNSPSPYPYQGRNPIDAIAASRAGPSSRRNLIDTEMEDRAESPAELAEGAANSVPRPPPSPSSTSQSDDEAGQKDFADLASIDDADTKINGQVVRSFDPAAVRLSRRARLFLDRRPPPTVHGYTKTRRPALPRIFLTKSCSTSSSTSLCTRRIYSPACLSASHGA